MRRAPYNHFFTFWRTFGGVIHKPEEFLEGMDYHKRYVCEKCKAVFADNAHLKRHLSRKTPCGPLIGRAPHGSEQNTCRYCEKSFSRGDSLRRHYQSCLVANSDEGLKSALKKQTEAFEVQQAQIQKLMAIIERLNMAQAATINVNNMSLTQVNVTLKRFDSDDRIRIPVAQVKAAFTENPILLEYCQMSDIERTDASKAAPYVLEALMELVRRAHRDPVYRNVHLNPKRADQVMVCVGEEERWEARPLADVIWFLFDGIAKDLQRIIVSDRDRSLLPLEVQGAVSWVPNLYRDEPERYVKEGRSSMAAHLQNIGTSTARSEWASWG